MYKSFYGLKESPFDVTPNPGYIYLGEHHREALARLLYGVRENKGFTVITGEVGTGKTTLLYCLLETLKSDNHTRTAFLFNPKLTVNDFIQYVLQDLGVKVYSQTKGANLHALYRYLLDAYLKKEGVVLIVDEAQGLNPELLEEIRLLSNFETAKSKLLQIILVGQPELDKTLSQTGYRQLRQRVNMRYHLQPLSEQDTRGYIEKRLRIAGAKEALFTENAIKEIYIHSGGIPRIINIVCDNALLTGYALDQKIVDKKLIREVAKDLNLSNKSYAISRRTLRWMIVCICVIGAAFLLLHLYRNNDVSSLYQTFLEGMRKVKEMAETILRGPK